MDFNPSSFLLPTPAGAFYAAASSENGTQRSALKRLLYLDRTPNAARFADELCAETGEQSILAMVQHGWIECLPELERAPQGSMESLLTLWLPRLTRGGQTLLADTQGFCLGSHGFSSEAAEEISALSAELANLHQRRSSVLHRHLNLETSAWGVCDAAGYSHIGFWPLYAGTERFVLVVVGSPAFNRPELVNLIWVLHQHYAVQR